MECVLSEAEVALRLPAGIFTFPRRINVGERNRQTADKNWFRHHGRVQPRAMDVMPNPVMACAHLQWPASGPLVVVSCSSFFYARAAARDYSCGVKTKSNTQSTQALYSTKPGTLFERLYLQ